MKKILAALVLMLFISRANAQDFTFGKIGNEDHLATNTQIDSNANAVYLNEFGTTRFSFDSETGKMMLVHEYHARIKIFNKEGFEAANIVIPTYKAGNGNGEQEFIRDIRASTFNFQNGRFEESPMNKSAVFAEEKSKYLTLYKFTLPNVKNNAIIEYQYTIETPYIFNFKTWHFQTNIPKLNSTYVAYIPANYRYNIALKGFYKLTDNKAELSKECLRVAGKEMDCSKLTYNMKNIPAFLEEDYMTSPNNYKSGIYFELSEVFYLNGSNQKYTKDWKDIDYELATSKDFGSQMKQKNVFKAIIPTVTAGLTTDLDKAKAIFDYIKKQIKWNNYYGKYSETSVKEVMDRRSGNVADVNLALISALSTAELDVEAVLLSTRENGMVNKLYPVMSEFNYVVAKVNADGESHLLDATEPLTPFGLLPLRCINDQGRVMSLKKPSYWMDLKASRRSSTIHSLIGKMDENGLVKATLSSYSSGQHGVNARKEIKKYTSIDEYVEKLDARLINIKIKDFKILGIDSVEKALSEEYEIEFTIGDATKASSYFNPFFINPIRRNPFKLSERNYPVDLGAASEERISINIALPDSYQLKEKPEDVAVGLPNQGGKYMLQTTLINGNLSVNQQLVFNKAIYSPQEYHYLKEFYNKVIQAQKTDLLLTKSK